MLLITLGGEQREKCKVGRKGRGEVQGFPAIDYTVYRGRAAVAQRSHEKKQRSHYQLPHHPHFHPQAAANAAAKENHDGRGRGDREYGVIIPALWLDLISARDPNTPSPATSPTFPEGAFPVSSPQLEIVVGGGCRGRTAICNLSSGEHCCGKGGWRALVPKPGQCPGTTCRPLPAPTPTLCLQRRRLTRTTGDTGSLGFSLISSWQQSPPG